ncbi:MAG: SDR family NAD(P)-dependent oxidoreductase [Ignavibacteria bacterium]|nr:SDR family NAD(P)-dependent oxidoreductase [Ignavibacteria bacterium]
MNSSHNTILITGGGTGIGLGLAEQFLKDNNTVIICGRRSDVLQEVQAKYPAIITKVCDVSVAFEREELYIWLAEHYSNLNVLVNNAGIQQWMSIDDENFYERSIEEIAINIEAPLHLTKLLLQFPGLTTIMNVSSGLAFAPLAKTPVYSATKAFIHSFTMSLRHLLQPKGIEVIEIIPPALNTDLGGKGLHDFAPPVSDFIHSVFEQLADGKTEITFGFSDAMSKASQPEIKQAFARMNGTSA